MCLNNLQRNQVPQTQRILRQKSSIERKKARFGSEVRTEPSAPLVKVTSVE
jgi:hypothetical protein